MFCSKFAKAKENLNPTSPKPKTKIISSCCAALRQEVCVKFCEDLWLHTMGLETWLCHTHEHHHHWASTNGIPTRNQWLLKRLPTHWLQHHCHHSHQNMWNFAPLKPQQFWFPRVLAILFLCTMHLHLHCKYPLHCTGRISSNMSEEYSAYRAILSSIHRLLLHPCVFQFKLTASFSCSLSYAYCHRLPWGGASLLNAQHPAQLHSMDFI